MGGVEVPQAPRKVRSGEGYLPPHWGKGMVWEGAVSPPRGLCPLRIKFFVFFVENSIF